MAWERSFQKRVNDIRKDELHWQARNYQIEVAFNTLWEITPVLVTVVSFLVSPGRWIYPSRYMVVLMSVQHYTLVAGKTLSPSIAFTSIAVFDELRFALATLPETFIQALQGGSVRGNEICQLIEQASCHAGVLSDTYTRKKSPATNNRTVKAILS